MTDLEQKAREIADEFVDECVTEEGYQAILKALADVREADAQVVEAIADSERNKLPNDRIGDGSWQTAEYIAAAIRQGVK